MKENSNKQKKKEREREGERNNVKTAPMSQTQKGP